MFRNLGRTATHDRFVYQDYQVRIGIYYLQHIVKPFADGNKVLDIGCAEGGVLKVFEQNGYNCTGLEANPERAKYANQTNPSGIKFICGSIESFSTDEQFDIILMLDVIEHIDEKLPILEKIKQLLLPEGIAVISFPPFRSPFGGHQQVMKSGLRYIPYVQLFPETVYCWLLEHIERMNVEIHLGNYQTGITIRQFEQLVSRAGLNIIKKINYFVRPRQALRFGLKIRQNRLRILQEYLSTGVTYILGS